MPDWLFVLCSFLIGLNLGLIIAVYIKSKG
jgi:hypothetical protein